jgi:hypothetical protein
MENAGLLYGHLEYFTTIWRILRPFGIFYGNLFSFCGQLVQFSSFGILYKETSGNPGGGGPQQTEDKLS